MEPPGSVTFAWVTLKWLIGPSMGLPVLVARLADLRDNYAENAAVNLFVEEIQ